MPAIDLVFPGDAAVFLKNNLLAVLLESALIILQVTVVFVFALRSSKGIHPTG